MSLPNPINVTYVSPLISDTFPFQYIVKDTDNIINIDTTHGEVHVILRNISNSGMLQYQPLLSINDGGNNASVNNITIYPSGGDVIQDSTEFVLNNDGANSIIQISNINQWVVLSTQSSGGSAPSGVLLQFPTPSQYTSYRTGDEGWRAQNNWFNYTPPTNPKLIAQLDYSLGANYWARLTEDISVGGVANKLRFVDVDGGQTFSATGNKNLITIDKYTGLGMFRTFAANGNWNTLIDAALTNSVIVNGVTFDNFYLSSSLENTLLFGIGRIVGNMIDPISLVTLSSSVNSGNDVFTSTTYGSATTNAINHPSLSVIKGDSKTLSTRAIFIFDATSLITAP